MSTADIEDLRWMQSMLKEKTSSDTVKDGGSTYEPDVRQLEMIVQEMELQTEHTSVRHEPRE